VYYRKVFTAVLSACVLLGDTCICKHCNLETLLLCSSVVTRKVCNIFAFRVVKLSTTNVRCLEAALMLG
jgi:hypothetical protein